MLSVHLIWMVRTYINSILTAVTQQIQTKRELKKYNFKFIFSNIFLKNIIMQLYDFHSKYAHIRKKGLLFNKKTSLIMGILDK